VAALAASFVACSSSHASVPPAPGASVTPPSCPDGFAPDAMGVACIDVTPASDCSAGTRAAFGASACQPVGWTTPCPTGFAADPSGWGCHEILPAAACTGATFESLGSTTCQPIGDCSAAFPPTGATLFVDASFTPAQIDATHFSSISAALAVAPAGAVVAVEAGTYAEAVEVTVPVSIVGRCAEKVILQGPGGELPGFQAAGVSGAIAIQGFTIAGFVGGVVEQDSAVSVDSCLLTGNTGSGVVAIGGSMKVTGSRIFGTLQDGTMGYGAALVQDGAELELTQVALVQNAVAGVAIGGPGDAKLTRTVVIDTRVRTDTQEDGSGIEVSGAGTVEITDSAIVGNHTHGVEVAGSGTRATVTGSVVRDTVPDTGGSAYGVQVDTGATATVDSSMLAGNAVAAVQLTSPKSKLTVTNSVVRGTNAAGDLVGMGIVDSVGATLSLTNVAVAGTRDTGLGVDSLGTTATVTASLFRDVVPFAGPTVGYGLGTGVSVVFGGKLTLTDSTVASCTLVGVEVGSACDKNYPTDCGGAATLSKVVVLSTQPDAKGEGVGLLGEDGGQITVDSSVFASNVEVGVVLTDPGTSATITGSIVRGTGVGTSTQFGYGLVVLDGATASLSGSFVRDNLGVALAFGGSSAGVDTTMVLHNQVGVYVTGATLEEVATPPDTLGPLQVVVSQSQFIDNVTRVSAEDLPLPGVSKVQASPPTAGP
jgi:hypothetical protein